MVRTAMCLETPGFLGKLPNSYRKLQASRKKATDKATGRLSKATTKLQKSCRKARGGSRRELSLDQLDKSCAKAARKPLANLLSLSLSPSPPPRFPTLSRSFIRDPPDEPNLPPRPLLRAFHFEPRATASLSCTVAFLQLSSSFTRLRH